MYSIRAIKWPITIKRGLRHSIHSVLKRSIRMFSKHTITYIDRYKIQYVCKNHVHDQSGKKMYLNVHLMAQEVCF